MKPFGNFRQAKDDKKDEIVVGGDGELFLFVEYNVLCDVEHLCTRVTNKRIPVKGFKLNQCVLFGSSYGGVELRRRLHKGAIKTWDSCLNLFTCQATDMMDPLSTLPYTRHHMAGDARVIARETVAVLTRVGNNI